MKKTLINLYSINELSEKARTIAISEHYSFLCSIDEWDDSMEEDVDGNIIESIEANNYLFFSDGKLAACTQFCGNHPKAGITELRIGLDTYIVTE